MRACGRRGGFRSDETGRGQQVGYGAQQAFLLEWFQQYPVGAEILRSLIVERVASVRIAAGDREEAGSRRDLPALLDDVHPV